MRPGIWQVVIVVVLIAVLFGAKKIPELARALGKAKGEFKKGLAEGAHPFLSLYENTTMYENSGFNPHPTAAGHQYEAAKIIEVLPARVY